MNESSILKLSEELLVTAKLKRPSGVLRNQFHFIRKDFLLTTVNANYLKRCFWINLYNAWFQILVADGVDRKGLFTSHPFSFADFKVTLDEIEHGILRKLKPHPSTGFPDEYSEEIKQLALSKEDYRIHFALNCGLKSCPPIAFYSADKIDEQLNLATQAYLEQETTYYPETNEIETNELLKWYIDDFGGLNGILSLLQSHDLYPSGKNPKLTFKAFDKADSILNFRS